MAIFLSFLAGSFVGFGNLFMRRSMDGGGSAQRFLVFQMFGSCVLLSIIEPLRQGSVAWSLPILGMGVVAGIILAMMLFLLGKALAQGPSGLTFSFLSSAAVMPGIVMAIWFGREWGFVYTIWHGIGSLFVLIGLFWGGRFLNGFRNVRLWLLFALSMFICHVLLLSLFQWRVFLLHLPHPEEIVSFISYGAMQSPWFLPAMFFSAGCIEWALDRKPLESAGARISLTQGLLGGLSSGLANFFLICGIEWATSLQHAILLPIFSVATIVISNLWSQLLYAERVNWRACFICLFGIVIGTVDWAILF